MAHQSGDRLGPYEIVSPLGAGGMGEVYKARDTRLDRTVAIKVLASEIAADPDLRARFEREARAVAALDHPHICALHDVGEADGVHFLVMQYLDGQTLAARLEKGALPLDHTLKIATEIAGALDKAHRAGITHRDLKPANIILTKAGAKLLDFGLAKLKAPANPIAVSGLTRLGSPTPQTASGTILGTIHYMAPEQVEGREADARSDLWALGAVIYEMATGARPFPGDTPASVIGAILKDQPPPASERQPLIPAMLDRLVSRCLAKDPDDRWQSAADLHQALTWIGDGVTVPAGAQTRGRSTRVHLWPIAIGALLLLVVVAMVPGWMAHVREGQSETVRLSVLPPPNANFSSPLASVVAPQVAVSPDGRRLAFVAAAARRRPGLWIRRLDALESQLLPGTEDALYPFWSPDSRSIGFFARGKLKTTDIAGGPISTVTDAPLDSRGGAWSRDGSIVFAAAATGVLYRVAATGGPVAPVTQLDASRGENSHRFPSFLPDGRHFLYAVRSERAEHRGIYVASLDSAVGDRVVEGTDWGAQFVPPGYLLFLRGTTLMAQPLDADRLRTTGEAVAIAQGVGSTSTSYAAFSASETGVLVYARQIGLKGELRWFDRPGASLESVGPAAEYIDVELSPDEQTVAVSVVDPQPNTTDIWLLDLGRSIRSRFTNNPMLDGSPIWSADGSRIVFRSNRLGTNDLYQKRSSGTGVEELVVKMGMNVVTSDWSKDGRYILYTNTSTTTGFDIWAWPTIGGNKPTLAVRTAFNAMHGRLSPDGRWLAYASDESGELQVYVQPFPATGDKWQISRDGGSEPRWRRDGHELFYLATDLTLTAVPIGGGTAFNAGTPKPLFEAKVPLTGSPYRTNYAVAANGQRFLVNTSVESAAPSPITVVLNWTAMFKK